ncbi:hypothetical protein HPB49_025552 [Dermacentor silvarum]|uniref:Uncharacterized protein n=1 Tax=Dermacentor silvarum TaxID=543639 RepID=A0ACB8C6L7_DERSI|nr:hypothetical protein HPB49_025552 [Dermacentor silvarum]
MLFLMPDVTSPVARMGWFPTPQCPTPTTPPSGPLPDLNWTACPSEKDVPVVWNFSLWDEKLAQVLRLRVQETPRTENGSWHAITDHIHVFSAFLVTTNEHAVHITSLVRSHETKGKGTPIRHPPLVCIIRTSNRTITSNAQIRLVWTWLNPSFKNALILCPPPKEIFLQDEDIRVAVAARYSGASSLRWLKLHRPPKKSPGKCCAVCVRPLFGAVSLWKVVEFIAHYRVVGARSFYFYDLNMTSDLKLLIARMQHLGVDVTLVPFKLIMNSTAEENVHAHGQMPSLYDCIFRSTFKMDYHVHVDIDELMVPMPNFSIPALVQQAERNIKPSWGSLVIQGVLSYHEETLATSVFTVSAPSSGPELRVTLPAMTCESASRFDAPAKPKTIYTLSLRTACPSKKDVPVVWNFSLWDEKLAQALRLRGQETPRTENESWHAITDHIHVFSAFLVTTNEHAVHITSLVRSHETKGKGTRIRHPPLVCIIRASNRTITSKAQIRLVWTWLNPSFKNALILCPPPKEIFLQDEDIRVAVAARYSGASSLRWLKLHRPPKKSPGKCCAVCVRPLFGAVSLWKVVEFIAHYRVAGARSFYFYDVNMTSDLKLLIARMQHLGVDVTLVPFKLIMDSTVEQEHVHAHGQMPSLYDCIFRSMFKMDYYVHVDLDELMVPMTNFSIPALVQQAERKSTRPLGSLVVPMRYHCLEYPRNMRYASEEFSALQTSLFPYHSGDIKHGGFTKYIARSRTVCEAGVHHIHKHCAMNTVSFLNSYEAYFRHYRQCCSFAPSSDYDQKGHFWKVTSLSADTSFVEFSARIERDPLVRALRCFNMD